ncbi:MAG: hypothetical protein WBP54_11520 [Pelodictyon phaeoclathratiforme]
MNPDFLDAHERHWEDAELLKDGNRLANADHLFGISAECGLKCLMIQFGMPMDTDKPKDRQDRIHANEIWRRFEAYRSGHQQGTNYALSLPDPFMDDWDVNQRYARRDDFDISRLASHRAGAEAVLNLIKKAKLAGLL